jgi:FdhD protein
MDRKAPEGAIAAIRAEPRPRRGEAEDRADSVAVEAPLEIRIGAKATTVLMRTPGDDEELVRGFLFTEGLIGRNEDVLALRRPEGLSGDLRGNVIAVDLAPSPNLAPMERLFYSSASCGVCGKTSIASLAVRASPIRARLAVKESVLLALPARLAEAQPVFSATGGVHASALFDPDGRLVAVREDVGRHNALDKLVGWALGERRLPLSTGALLVSGRVSYEIIQKSIVAGIPIVAAVGAPSSLAIDLAGEFGVTLVGFLRGGTMNVYAHPERVVEG